MLKKIFTPVSILVLLGGLAGVALVLYAWRLPPFLSTVEMTDNAFVRGYVTTMSPQVSGYVVDVPVKDYQEVKQGTLLAKIDLVPASMKGPDAAQRLPPPVHRW